MPISLFSRMQEGELLAQRERHAQFILSLQGPLLDELRKEAGKTSSRKAWDGYGVTITPAGKTRIQRRDGMTGLVICTDRHALISDVFHTILQQGGSVGAVRPDNRLKLFRLMALAAFEALDKSDALLADAICSATGRALAREVSELEELACHASAGMALP